MFKRKTQPGRQLWVRDRSFSCHVCGGMTFFQREVKLNTTGLALLDMEWLNSSADGAVCETCGYVHLFFGDRHQWQ